MRRLVAGGIVAVIAAGLALGVVPGTSAPAAAACLPWASINPCNPAALAIMAEAGGGGVVATVGGEAAVATVATVAGTSAAGSAAVTLAGAVAVGLTSIGLVHLLVDGDSPLVSPGGVPGFVGGVNTFPDGTYVTVTTNLQWGEYGQSLVVDVYGPSGYNNVWSCGHSGSTATTCGLSTSTVVAGTSPWTNRHVRLSGTVSNNGSPASGLGYIEIVHAASTGANGGPAGTVRWYPVGAPDYPVNAPQLVGVVEGTYGCQGASGGVSYDYTSTPVTAVPADGIDVPEYNCPAGSVLVSALVEWTTSEGSQVIYTYNSDDVDEGIKQAPVEWPGCINTVCELSLWQLVSGTRYAECGPAAIGCPDWWKDPAKADNYQCHYGPYTVDLGRCGVFREPGQVKANTMTVTDPSTGQKVSTPVVNSTDPEDYKAIPDPDPVPDPDGTTVPGPEPCAGEGCLALPWPDPVDDPGVQTRCFPQGWGVFNPLSWVYMPIKCALVWAFVPAPAVVAANLERGQGALTSHGILGVIPEAVAVPGQIAGGFTGGCTGGLLSLDVSTWAGTLHAGLPCAPGDVAPAFAGPYSTFRTLLGVVIVGGTVWGVFITVRAYFGGRDA